MTDAGRQTFRSPAAVAIWWLWMLFATGNLIDLAVQGRDHQSVVAVCALLLITGVVYATAFRPRVIADQAALTVANPLRDHRIDWLAVAGVDTTDLLRVRCEWPAENGPRHRAIYAWAVHSSHRSRVAAQRRANRRSRQGGAAGFGTFGSVFGSGAPDAGPPPASLGVNAAHAAEVLTERAEKARAAAPEGHAPAPVTTWHWPTVAAVAAPAIALLVATLA
jgi:hypothetical protein